MKKLERTPWFDGSKQKPWEPGVYERRFLGDCIASRWDGLHWCLSHGTIEQASRESILSDWQQLPWRGLTKEAK